MLTLWAFFRHPYWHIAHIVLICQENLTLKIFLPLSNTWLFFLQFHCSTAPQSILTEQKKARRIKMYQKEFTVDGWTRNILEFSLAINFHGSPQGRYRCCSTSNLLIPSHYITILKTFHSSTNNFLPINFSICSAGCAVHFHMHLLGLRCYPYCNFWLRLVLLKDYTNVPMFHMQVKLCPRKWWCVTNSSNTTSSSGGKYWIHKRSYSKGKCSHLKTSPG